VTTGPGWPARISEGRPGSADFEGTILELKAERAVTLVALISASIPNLAPMATRYRTMACRHVDMPCGRLAPRLRSDVAGSQISKNISLPESAPLVRLLRRRQPTAGATIVPQ
jgi:hypothetical protein